MKKLNNPLLKIALPPILLLVIHVTVTETGLYDKFWWFDTPMHFLGGILVSISTIQLFKYFSEENELILNSLILKILLIIAITTLFAVSWEVIEFLIDIYFHADMQPSVSDTMKDMAMGIIGANVVCGYLWLRSFKK